MTWKLKISFKVGHTVAQLVKALRYKPDSHGFDSRWSIGILHGLTILAALWA